MSTRLHYGLSRRFFRGRQQALTGHSTVPAALITPRVAGLAVLAALSSAVAADSPLEREFIRRPYVGIGFGATDLDPESRTNSLTVGDDRDSGGALFLGYDFSPRFSLEGYYSDLGEARIDFLGDDVGSVEYQVYGLSVIGYLANSRDRNDYIDICANCDNEGLYRREGLSPFLRLGVGGMRNDSNLDIERDHITHLTVGGGLEYGWSNGFALRAEIISYDTDAHYAGISLFKRFGDASPRMHPVGENITPVTRPSAAVDVTDRPLDFPVPTFPFAKFGVTAEAAVTLIDLAEQMQLDEGLDIIISGHTDAVGSENFNRTLSLKRAASVKAFLIKEGITSERMILEGLGESQPVGDNATEQGRAQNRRVQIRSR